jgi:hypothetical protein
VTIEYAIGTTAAAAVGAILYTVIGLMICWIFVVVCG